MRDVDSSASRDWLADRGDEPESVTGPEGKADAHVEGVTGGGGGFTAVTLGETVVFDQGVDWLQQLKFDDSGRKVDAGAGEVPVEGLAKLEKAWAQFAADALVGAASEADKNNRACALAYANPDDVNEAYQVLKSIHEPGAIARGNLGVLSQRVRVP